MQNVSCDVGRFSLPLSGVCQEIKQSVLSNIDLNSFYRIGVLVLTIPAQSELPSLVRSSTGAKEIQPKEAEAAKQIAALAQRFCRSGLVLMR